VTKDVACKGVWPCEDTLEALYEAISYCNALGKRVKLPIEGGKGVIIVGVLGEPLYLEGSL
jgi:hypothetical protein